MSEITDRLVNRANELGLKQSDLVKNTEAGKSTVFKWFSHLNDPSAKFLDDVAKVLKTNTAWLLTGNGNPNWTMDGQSLESMQVRPVIDEEESELEDDEFEYPHYHEVYVTGGDKEIPILESSTEPSKMKKSIARKAGASMSQTFSYNLYGDSMSPKIMDKACVTADASKKVVKDGKIYVFRHGVMRRTKYLYNRPDGGLLIRSENREEYPDEIVPKNEMECIEIIGWVYHWCNMEVW